MPDMNLLSADRWLPGGTQENPWLELQAPGKTDSARYALINFPFVIGRGDTCSLTIDSACVSRQHACILQDGASYTLKDMGSTNGTKLNGEAVKQAKLEHGDTISIANIQMIFCCPEPEASQCFGTMVLEGENSLSSVESDLPLLSEMTEAGRLERVLTGAVPKFWRVEALDRNRDNMLLLDRQGVDAHPFMAHWHFLRAMEALSAALGNLVPPCNVLVPVLVAETRRPDFTRLAQTFRAALPNHGLTSVLLGWQEARQSTLEQTVSMLTDAGWLWGAGETEAVSAELERLRTLPPRCALLSVRATQRLAAKGEKGKPTKQWVADAASLEIPCVGVSVDSLEILQAVKSSQLAFVQGKAIARAVLSAHQGSGPSLKDVRNELGRLSAVNEEPR